MSTYQGSKFNHAEAFCVMNYQCESCGHNEKIWNSRDGVTPFIVPCPVCNEPTHKHINWKSDVFSPLHSMTMKPGERYFINLTLARAREIATIRVDRAIESGEIQPNQRNRVITTVMQSYFGDGVQPDIALKS